jgi:hypothetical protein
VDDVPERVARRGALSVWIASPLGLLLRDIAISLRATRALVSFIQIAPSRVTPLLSTLLPPTHRRGHQQHHHHDRNRDDDYYDTGANRERRGVKSDMQRPASSSVASVNRISAEAPRLVVHIVDRLCRISTASNLTKRPWSMLRAVCLATARGLSIVVHA